MIMRILIILALWPSEESEDPGVVMEDVLHVVILICLFSSCTREKRPAKLPAYLSCVGHRKDF